jgi:hypothetical protein
MMKKVYRFLLAFAVLSFTACKEDDGLSQTSFVESPRFYVNATVNGLPISYKAGEGNYQMYTNYQVQDSVLHMYGVLATDSPAYRNALRLNIRGAELISNMAYPSAGNVFEKGALPLYDPSGLTALPGHFDYHFSADSVNGHIPLIWHTPSSSYYGDSCFLIGLNQANQQSFTVEMQSAGPLSCTPSVKHTIRTGQDSKAQLHIVRNSNSELSAEVQARIGRIQKVTWEVDGANAGNGQTMQYSAVGFSASFQVKASVEFEDGGVEVIEKVVLPGGSACDINIDYQKRKHRVQNPHNLKTVEIQYYDADGKLYSSAYPLSQGNFNIESISDYHDSNSAHKHQRFSFSGNAILKSADGSTLEINNIFGSFAVAHP